MLINSGRKIWNQLLGDKMRLKEGFRWMIYNLGSYCPKDNLEIADRVVGYAKSNSIKVIPFARHDHHPKVFLYDKAVEKAREKGILD